MKPLKLTLSLLVLPMLASAQTVCEKNGYLFELHEGQEPTAALVARYGTDGNIIPYTMDDSIPGSVEYNGVAYSVVSVGKKALAYCSNSDAEVSLPYSVINVADSAFCGATLASIEMGQISYVPNYCFAESRIGQISLPSTVEQLGVMSFSNCNETGNIQFHSISAPKADPSAFDNSSVREIYIPLGSVESYRSEEVWNDQTWSIKEGFPIRSGELYYLLLTETSAAVASHPILGGAMRYSYNGIFEIPERIIIDGRDCEVTSIGDGAMNMAMNAKELKIPATVEYIGSGAFADASYSTIVFGDPGPESLELAPRAFFGTRLESIQIPDGVQNIPNSTFLNCFYLQEVVLPLTVSEIGETAFLGCEALTVLTVNAIEPPTLDNEVFEVSTYESCRLRVPAISVEKYRVAKGWSDFMNIESFDSGTDGLSIGPNDETTDAPALYYNLGGVKVDGKTPTTGIYLKKTGYRTEKVVIR